MNDIVGDGDVVYVVVRSVGEYSDRDDSPVAVYTDEAMAKAHVKTATDAEIAVHRPWYYDKASYFYQRARSFREVPAQETILQRELIPQAGGSEI